jgi:murein DD-endopeptidase MepM/ murein hydrolase activator NlpD
VKKRRSGWHAVPCVLAIALLLAPYTASAFAAVQSPPLADGASGAAQQAMTVSSAAVLPSEKRESYSMTTVLQGQFTPFARIADTFVNDRTAAIQWPFTTGVPINKWFSAGHTGLDMNPGIGTPIQAIADGTVIEIGNPSGSYGVYAIIEHEVAGLRFTSLYGHMLQGSLAVKVGDVVAVGQLVGQVGSSGASTGPHLHFSIYLNGVAVDPYAWLKVNAGY